MKENKHLYEKKKENQKAKWKMNDEFRENQITGMVSRRYGVHAEEAKSLILNRRRQCDLCGTKSDSGNFIDHCHECGVVRGVLCRNCNFAIGAFYDSPEAILSAISYLSRGLCLADWMRLQGGFEYKEITPGAELENA